MMYQRVYHSDVEEGTTSEGEHRETVPSVPPEEACGAFLSGHLWGARKGGRPAVGEPDPCFHLQGAGEFSGRPPRHPGLKGSEVNATWLAADAEMRKIEREREEAEFRAREPFFGAGRGDLTGGPPCAKGKGEVCRQVG